VSTARAEDGFTLIEVLAALVILAVGLLSVEALGIGASRSVTFADRQSEYAVASSAALESALQALRSDSMPDQWCHSGALAGGATLSRAIDVSDPKLVRVTVRATPDPEGTGPRPDAFEISSSAYLPNGISGTPSGSPCS
jgi:prepilin-type N-terminal cleavage/methylation domain-containing protein